MRAKCGLPTHFMWPPRTRMWPATQLTKFTEASAMHLQSVHRAAFKPLHTLPHKMRFRAQGAQIAARAATLLVTWVMAQIATGLRLGQRLLDRFTTRLQVRPTTQVVLRVFEK